MILPDMRFWRKGGWRIGSAVVPVHNTRSMPTLPVRTDYMALVD